MLNTERRIAALEAHARDDSIKIIIAEDGQTQADAVKPAGLMPDAPRVVWATQSDEGL